MINLPLREGVDEGLVSTAEAATLELELRYLSFLTDDDAVERVGIFYCADLLGIQLTKRPYLVPWRSSSQNSF